MLSLLNCLSSNSASKTNLSKKRTTLNEKASQYLNIKYIGDIVVAEQSKIANYRLDGKGISFCDGIVIWDATKEFSLYNGREVIIQGPLACVHNTDYLNGQNKTRIGNKYVIDLNQYDGYDIRGRYKIIGGVAFWDAADSVTVSLGKALTQKKKQKEK